MLIKVSVHLKHWPNKVSVFLFFFFLIGGNWNFLKDVFASNSTNAVLGQMVTFCHTKLTDTAKTSIIFIELRFNFDSDINFELYREHENKKWVIKFPNIPIRNSLVSNVTEICFKISTLFRAYHIKHMSEDISVLQLQFITVLQQNQSAFLLKTDLSKTQNAKFIVTTEFNVFFSLAFE